MKTEVPGEKNMQPSYTATLHRILGMLLVTNSSNDLKSSIPTQNTNSTRPHSNITLLILRILMLHKTQQETAYRPTYRLVFSMSVDSKGDNSILIFTNLFNTIMLYVLLKLNLTTPTLYPAMTTYLSIFSYCSTLSRVLCAVAQSVQE